MYEYVSKKTVKIYKARCNEYLSQLKKVLQDKYQLKVQSSLIGSGSKALVTRNGNEPFDLDYNLVLKSMPEDFEQDPKKLKDTVRVELDKIIHDNSSVHDSHGKDSTAPITYFFPARFHGEEPFGLDLGIIWQKKGQALRLIHLKKDDPDRFVWNEVFDSKNTEARAKKIQEAKQWNELRNEYLKLKNGYLKNQSKDISSYVVYVEAVNNVFSRLKGEL
ncbi:hypothetical protein [Lactobacillus sp.]|uniref:hypothetical protein n=1 Tax=Lactobacillus sp. TaxID=1591 RepID=UPI003EF1D92A